MADKTKTPEEAAIPEAVSTTGPKMVTVLGIEDHETSIGGVRYIIVDKEQCAVPEDVAMILQNAKVAIRVK